MSIQSLQSASNAAVQLLTALPGNAAPNAAPNPAKDEQASASSGPLAPAYQVSLSQAAQRLAKQNPIGSSDSPEPDKQSGTELTPDEEREVADLQKRDREVRAHEAAHKAAAGSLSSGSASFSFTTGPDGKRYATSGEVSIDTSAVSGDAEATVRKMQQVRAAALAPASPSSQDRKVAAQATAAAQAARSDAARNVANDTPEGSEASGGVGSGREPQGLNDTANKTQASCSVCGAGDHGPEMHASPKARSIDLLA